MGEAGGGRREAGGGRREVTVASYLEELIKKVVGLCGEACVDTVVRLPYPEDSTITRLVGGRVRAGGF